MQHPLSEHPLHRELHFVTQLVKCNAELLVLDASALTALFTEPFDQSAAADALDAIFAVPEGGFAPKSMEAIMLAVANLMEQVVVLLGMVDWADMVARMRGKPALHTPGIMHEPTFLTSLEQATQRRRSCCCWAEVLLLLVYAVLQDCALAVPSVLAPFIVADHIVVQDVWQPLCSAMQALLTGLQPGFRSYPNGVNMVSDCVQVRLRDIRASDATTLAS